MIVKKKSQFMSDAETLILLSDIGHDCDHCTNTAECSICTDYFAAYTDSGEFIGNFDTEEEAADELERKEGVG